MQEENISEIINQLIEIGKCIVKVQLSEEIDCDIFPEIDCSNDFKKIKDMIIKIGNLLNSCYNVEIIEMVKISLKRYKNMLEATVYKSEPFVVQVIPYFESFGISYNTYEYIKKQEGYKSVFKLVDNVQFISSIIYRYKAMEYIQLIGINSVLEDFEENLAIIENIKCDNLKNALLDYIDNEICFNDFKKENNI